MVTESRSVSETFGVMEMLIWWWLPGYRYLSKFTFNKCILLYVNYTSIKLISKKI